MELPQSTAKGFSIRPARPGDELFLLELYTATRTFELQAVGWGDAQIRHFCQMQFRAQTWQHNLTYNGAVDQIVELDGQPIGRLKSLETATQITLVDIALLPRHQNQGIGTKLLEQLKAHANTVMKPIVLHVLVTSPGIHLYERLGFRRITDDGSYIEMEYHPGS